MKKPVNWFASVPMIAVNTAACGNNIRRLRCRLNTSLPRNTGAGMISLADVWDTPKIIDLLDDVAESGPSTQLLRALKTPFILEGELNATWFPHVCDN